MRSFAADDCCLINSAATAANNNCRASQSLVLDNDYCNKDDKKGASAHDQIANTNLVVHHSTSLKQASSSIELLHGADLSERLQTAFTLPS